MKKKLMCFLTGTGIILLETMPVFAAGFDSDTAKSTINSYLNPLREFLLWFIPVAFVISALVTGAKWFFMDEREREQRPIAQSLTKLAIAAVVIWSIPVIATIIGLTTN